MSVKNWKARADIASLIIKPFATPMLLNVDKVSDAAQAAALWGIKRFATAGTGARIATLTGIYADRAALAYAGGGPLLMGGKGMAGGTANLRVLGGVTVTISAAALVAAAVNARRLQSKAEVSTQTRTCCECQKTFSAGQEASEDTILPCPDCAR